MDAELLTTFCVGCCPIDHLNEKEILGALKKIFLPGNYLSISADGLLVASILQTKIKDRNYSDSAFVYIGEKVSVYFQQTVR